MFIVSNFINAFANVLYMVLTFYMYLIVIRAVLSWFSPDPYNPLYQILIRITEPVLNYIRRVLPFRTGMMDFSPFIAIIAIIFLREFLVKSLIGLAARIG